MNRSNGKFRSLNPGFIKFNVCLFNDQDYYFLSSVLVDVRGLFWKDTTTFRGKGGVVLPLLLQMEWSVPTILSIYVKRNNLL